MTNYTDFKFTIVPTDSQMLYKVPFWYVGESEFQRAANYKWQIVTVIREMTDVNGDTWYGAYFGADFTWFRPAAGKIENTKPKKIDKTATLNEFGVRQMLMLKCRVNLQRLMLVLVKSSSVKTFE